MSFLTFAFELSFDPHIRGILATAVGVVVLCGSVYLLLATNTGARLGFLIAATGLAGWMVITGVIWWLYAGQVGYTGPGPSWQLQEVVTHDDPRDLSVARTPEVRELGQNGGWREIPEGDTERGEIESAGGEGVTDDRFGAYDEDPFMVLDVYERGGENYFLTLRQRPLYAVVQTQRAIPQEFIEEGDPCPEATICVPFGDAPPPQEVDPDAPIVSAVLLLDQGHERLPPALVTLSSLAIFGVLASTLHRRDKLVTEARARAEAGAGA